MGLLLTAYLCKSFAEFCDAVGDALQDDGLSEEEKIKTIETKRQATEPNIIDFHKYRQDVEIARSN